jgi:hypothetical protein
MNDVPRFHRWVKASFATTRYERFMPVTVQGLGRLDKDLFKQDKKLLAGLDLYQDGGDPGAISYHLTLSYLWVLGVYEVLRSINQSCRNSGNKDDQIDSVLRKYERLRIPLAKFEPAKKHKDTDSKIAYPSINPQVGIAWQLGDDFHVSRADLSDSFLELLERKVL